MAEIGRKGFAATVARHWQGDATSYLAHQRALANQAVVEALTDIQLNAELARGRDMACVELPADEEYEPQPWRDRVRGSQREQVTELPW